MRPSLLALLSLAAPILADGCHDSNDSIGQTCQFNPAQNDLTKQSHFMDAATIYCYQFRNPFTVPKGTSSSNIYQIKIQDLPDGYGGSQIFWGNYKVVSGSNGHAISWAECLSYMQNIDRRCNGYGGWVDTDFGTVFGECIRQNGD